MGIHHPLRPQSDILGNVDRCASLRDLGACLKDIRAQYGMNGLDHRHVAGPGTGTRLAASAFPEEQGWQAEIERWLESLAGLSRGLFQPLDWQSIGRGSSMAFADAPNDRDLQGYSIPLFGPRGHIALFSIYLRCPPVTWQTFLAEQGHDIFLIAHCIGLRAFSLAEAQHPKQPLSPRETQALSLLALGQARSEVARSMEISEHTLRAYIENARLKLGATNTLHAVCQAQLRGCFSG